MAERAPSVGDIVRVLGKLPEPGLRGAHGVVASVQAWAKNDYQHLWIGVDFAMDGTKWFYQSSLKVVGHVDG